MLQFGEGRIDVADGDDAGDAGHRDHGEQNGKTAKRQVLDRERRYPSKHGGKGSEHRQPDRVSTPLYDFLARRVQWTLRKTRSAGMPPISRQETSIDRHPRKLRRVQ